MDFTAAVLFCFHLASTVRASVNPHHSSLSVAPPHLNYVCPVGANVTLHCGQAGALAHPTDRLEHAWLFTTQAEQRCHGHTRPRHGNPSGVHYGASRGDFWVSLQEVTHKDQGRYCCLALDVLKEKGHPVQQAHSHVILTITPRQNASMKCTVSDPKQQSEGSVVAGFATAGCIMSILCLPLILVLVYRQRQSTQSNRRAHELVRMDSEVQGHENPVFLEDSPQAKTRTVSQIMTRQSSETGRHLLSDPGTPLSPMHGDMFFPAHDPIPESPDLLQV